MTKKELLEMLNTGSIFKQTYPELYNKYYLLIEATLRSYSDEVKIEGWASLKGFDKKNAFDNFIRENDFETVKNKIVSIDADLQTWVNNYSNAKNAIEVNELNKQKIEKYNKANKQQRDRHDKKHKVFSRLIIPLIILGLATAIFALLKEFKVVECGADLAAITGSLDFIIGVAFFVYELKDDKKKKKEQNTLSRDIQEIDEQIKNINISIMHYQEGEIVAAIGEGAQSAGRDINDERKIKLGSGHYYDHCNQSSSTGGDKK